MDRSEVSSSDRFLTVVGMRAAVAGVLYPFEYGKTLMQLGYEPVSPWPVKGITGKQHMMLPNIFQYVSHMSRREEKWGLYNGVKLRVVEILVSQVAHRIATDSLFPEEQEPKDEQEEEEEDLPDNVRRERYYKQFLKDLAGRTAAVVVSHPFHVISIRAMAQFVGRETKYFDVFRSMRELYRENGVSGYFSGLVPRLLGEVLQLAIWHSLTYVFTTYVFTDKETKALVSTGMGYIASSVTYPFAVVSKCMCVSGSGLVAGQPPIMPIYSSWIDCWSQLSATDQLWRASSVLLWRYDTRPAKFVRNVSDNNVVMKRL